VKNWRSECFKRLIGLVELIAKCLEKREYLDVWDLEGYAESESSSSRELEAVKIIAGNTEVESS